ncbi:MAG: 50S ribosomal protein L10 [Thermoprotei archaeon]|nr:MAG: 50S ribosomal protein L10 [Thermoprotei archaeon]RLF18621.1 MAG: 50S ribosomal protein L10 [Thermoprotei archaeon]
MKTLSFQVSPRARKEALVKTLMDLLEKYRVVAIADVTGLRANQFQRLRMKLRGIAEVKMAKNTLMRIAIERLLDKKPELKKLAEYLTGSNAFVFTNESAFALYMLLERNKVSAKAKPGDKASKDIYIPAGNTGLPPGPILSMFKMLKVPTRIEEGSIYVSKDTLVLKKGEVISREAADLLSKLGIEPIEVGLKVKTAYEDGLILTEQDLALDLEAYKGQLAEAYSNALRLSIAVTYPTVDNAELLLAKAQSEAWNLAVNAALPVKEAVEMLLQRAEAEARALEAILPKAS